MLSINKYNKFIFKIYFLIFFSYFFLVSRREKQKIVKSKNKKKRRNKAKIMDDIISKNMSLEKNVDRLEATVVNLKSKVECLSTSVNKKRRILTERNKEIAVLKNTINESDHLLSRERQHLIQTEVVAKELFFETIDLGI